MSDSIVESGAEEHSEGSLRYWPGRASKGKPRVAAAIAVRAEHQERLMASAYSLICEYQRKKQAADKTAERLGRAIAEDDAARREKALAGAALADAIRRLGKPVLDTGSFPGRMYTVNTHGWLQTVEVASVYDEVPEDEEKADDGDGDASGTASGDEGPAEGPLDGGTVVPDPVVDRMQAVAEEIFGSRDASLSDMVSLPPREWQVGDEVESPYFKSWEPAVVEEAESGRYLVRFANGSSRVRQGSEIRPRTLDALPAPVPAGYDPLHAEAPPVAGGAPEDTRWMSDPEAGAPPLGPRPCRACGSL